MSKTELFTYLLKSNRLDRSKFDKNLLVLEKHLYQGENEDGGVDFGSSSTTTTTSGGGGSSSSSSSS